MVLGITRLSGRCNKIVNFKDFKNISFIAQNVKGRWREKIQICWMIFLTYFQDKASLIKTMDVVQLIDKRVHTTLGYFIFSKYEEYIKHFS